MSHYSETVLTDEENAWVAQFAGRLRLVLADGATATPAQRREYLKEEIERGLRGVPPANHKRFLGALLTRFPVAGQTMSSPPATRAIPSRPEPPAPPPETPEETLSRFLAAAINEPEDGRRKLASQFFKSGFGQYCGGIAEIGTPPEVRTALGLAEGQEPRLDRLLQLCAQLLENVCETHKDAQKTLRELLPGSQLLRKQEDMRKAAGRFLTGEIESAQAQMGVPMGSQYKFLKALFAAMLGGPIRYERAYIRRFKPERILDIVDAEGVKAWQNREALCWRKYLELSEDYVKEGVIRKDVKDCLGAYVEQPDAGPR